MQATDISWILKIGAMVPKLFIFIQNPGANTSPCGHYAYRYNTETANRLFGEPSYTHLLWYCRLASLYCPIHRLNKNLNYLWTWETRWKSDVLLNSSTQKNKLSCLPLCSAFPCHKPSITLVVNSKFLCQSRNKELAHKSSHIPTNKVVGRILYHLESCGVFIIKACANMQYDRKFHVRNTGGVFVCPFFYERNWNLVSEHPILIANRQKIT
jgi:hypothetical protein